MAIINSILDTDFYKTSMMYAVMQSFPDLKVRYKFTDRNKTRYPKGFAEELMFEVSKMSEICLTDKEADYLNSLSFFPKVFIDFLKGYRFNPEEITATQDKDGHLDIAIEGLWVNTILWEVPLMALISELYFIETNQQRDIYEFINQDAKKAKLLAKHNAYYADFGTRRRFSKTNHDRIVGIHCNSGSECFVGTSNIKLAMEHNIKPIGTMAHEWIMVFGALYGYKMANSLALEKWVDVYDGDLGIALSDTYTTKIFFKSFTRKLAKLFDGVRHDSGDPFEFTDNVIKHYESLGINPQSKTIIFSDGLDPDLAVKIKKYCSGKIISSFGIGTNFTNDVGVQPLNIVIKVSEVLHPLDNEWYPCAKLSDNSGKHTGDIEEINLCKGILRIQ